MVDNIRMDSCRTSIVVAMCLASALAAPNEDARVASQKYRWNNVEIVGGGFVSGILFHPKQRDLCYARTDIGGAYRWDPRSKRWVQLLDWIQRPDWNLYGVESIGLDPTDPKRLYLALGTYTNQWAGNGAILRSTDQGRTFQRTDMPFKMGGNHDGRSIGERLAVDPNENNVLFFGSRDNGLWRSEDFGATWTKQDGFPITGRTNGIGICFELFDASTGKKGQPTPTIYVGASSKTNLYRSTDGGSTWAAVPGQPEGVTPHHAAFDRTGAMIITYSNAPGPNGVSGGSVWRLDPKQDTWTDVTPNAGKGFGYAGLSLDAQHPGTMVVTSLDRWKLGDDVFRTTDGGLHWAGMKDTAKLDCSGSPFLNWGQKAPKFGWWMGTVQIDPFDSGHILYGTGATIWGCDDGTNVDRREPTHWTPRAQGLEETAVIDLISPPAGAHLFTGLGDIGGFRHEDLMVAPREGMMLNPLFNNIDGMDFAELKPNIMCRVGRGGVGDKRGTYSTDGGKSWNPFPSEPKGTRGSGHIAVSADGGAIVWSPTGAPPNVSHDFGATWTPSEGVKRELCVVSDRVNPKRFYGFDTRSGALYASSDASQSFVTVAAGLPTGDMRLRALPGIEGDLWLAAGKGLYHSTDAGLSFAKLSNVSDVSTVGFGKSAPGQSYPSLYFIGACGGIEGAFRSDDAARTWACITDPQHGFGTMDQIVGDPRLYGRVYIGTNGRGVLYGDPAGSGALISSSY